MQRFAPLALLTVVAACATDQPLAPASADATAAVSSANGYVFDVTITNLTTGQPLSPAIVVTHGPRARLFTVGAAASPGIQAIAENGDPSVAYGMLHGAPGVLDVVATAAPMHRIGGPGPTSQTLQITGDAERRLLSLATMLICTNDGFAGASGITLPTDENPVTVYLSAYDAGTERNSELDGDIVPPCFGIGPAAGTGGAGRTAEQLRIRMHPGIDGPRALSVPLHGWTGPVAMVTIQRAATVN